MERPFHENLEIRDRDAENKGKMKMVAYARRGAKPSDVDLGDHVLVRQERQNKLTTAFCSTPHTVVSKSGNSLIIEAPSSAQYSRNTSHVKRYQEPPVLAESLPLVTETGNSPVVANPTDVPNVPSHTEHNVVELRPQRVRTFPQKYDDFIT